MLRETAGQLRSHGELPQAGGGGAVVIGEVNADELAVKLVRSDRGGTGTGEGIENDVVRFRECCDQGFERLHGLLRRVQAVSE